MPDTRTGTPDDRAVVLDVLHAYYADADSWAEAESGLRATTRRLPAAVRPTSLAVDRFLRDRADGRGLADLVVREARWVLPDPGDDAAAGFLGAIADLLRTLDPDDPDDPDPALPATDPHATRTLEGALHGDPRGTARTSAPAAGSPPTWWTGR
ncbi:hypothetical protein [Kineococcus sp. SYSU DK002]|uniref:hypothetical protein n=1 Tax=Kineococcus sp. SYSU DK002 TaxID=3383123 RepID=UPI003D7EAE98